MVERAVQAANSTYLVDFIPLTINPRKLKSDLFYDLYVNQQLSANQIATKIGCSKAFVLSRLQRLGIPTQNRQNNPRNYLIHQTPFGFTKKNHQLVPNRRELKIIRIIVHLRKNKKMTFAAIAKELERQQFKNRFGRVSWQYCVVRKFFHRWKEKI